MANQNTDVVSPQLLATGQHYYSSGQHLRDKHRFAGNAYVDWALDLISQWPSAKILDAGGGWGRYIWRLVDAYGVQAHNTTLTDLSIGMLTTAQEEAAHRNLSINVTACNIESLPFADEYFDIVMANKVLYHLLDINQGIHELARTLKSEGILMATTNSEKILATVIDLHYQALERLGIAYEPEPPSTFSMENGAELLAAHFGTVETYYYESETLIHEAAQMRAVYETIGRYRHVLARNDISEADKQALPATVEQIAQETIDREGVLRSPSLMGAFICSQPVATR